MADIEHSAIPDAGRHEPKGASTAAVDTVHKSDGAGGTLWEKVDYSELTGAPAVPVAMGAYLYEDTATSGSPIALTLADTDYDLTNDGLGSNSTSLYGLSGVTPYDISTNRFDFSDLSLGDTVDIRVTLDAITGGTNHEVTVKLILDVGGTNIEIPFIGGNNKTAATHKKIRFNSVFIGSEAVRTGPAKLVAQSDATGDTIVVDEYYIRVFKNG